MFTKKINTAARRTKTPEQALASMMRLCARSERSSGDARRLMRGWGLSPENSERLIERLVAERFIDDERYAAAFVRDKMNLSGWGLRKMESALRAKGIPAEIVRRTLDSAGLTDEQVRERLLPILARRLRTLKYSSPSDGRAKLIRYALSRGYDYAAARDCTARLLAAADCDFDADISAESLYE